MTRRWTEALAISTVLLGGGYALSGVGVGRTFHDAIAGLLLGGVGVGCAALGAGVWRGRSGAKAGATVAGLFGTLVLGAMAVGSHRDRDASDAVNNVDMLVLFGLAGLSALVLATAVALAVAESIDARKRRESHVG